jgi:hypothetical protein
MAIASPEMALLLDRGLLKRCSHHDIDSEDPRRIGAGDTLDYNLIQSITIMENDGAGRRGSSGVGRIGKCN